MKTLLTLCLFLCLSGCEGKSIVSPSGWRADFGRLLTEYEFDKAKITFIDPNGTVVIVDFEKFKSDSTRSIDLAEKLILSGGGAAAGSVIP